MKLTPLKDLKVFLGILAAVSIPAGITLSTIDTARRVISPVEHSSPLGYTWSLLLFLVPVAAIVIWLFKYQEEKMIRKSFWISLLLLIPLGFILDIFFGLTFFTFNNPGATLGINVYGFDLATMSWHKEIPIEEFIFYLSGFVAVLLIYIWCDEYWLGAYNVPDYSSQCRKVDKIVKFHLPSLQIGLVLIGLGILYKYFASHHYQNGFPGYFTFLVIASFVPSAAFFKTASPFINWRAFSFTFFLVLLISLLWEATLAAPYQWWGYQYNQMLGMTIDAWTGLPIEAVLVWMAVTFTTVIFYETTKIWLYSGHELSELVHRIIDKISLILQQDPRLKFVVMTMLVALGCDLIAWAVHSGWVGAAAITYGLNLWIIYYLYQTRDRFMMRLYVFGLLVGFGELPTDYLAVAVQKTLVYAPNEPFIWESPLYMPFAWAIIFFQIGYIAYWLLQRVGLKKAAIYTGLLGAVNIPMYEFIAKQAGFWYYRDTWMVLFDSTPVYVIAGEFLITLVLPYIVKQLHDSNEWVAGWAFLMSVWMFIATMISFQIFG